MSQISTISGTHPAQGPELAQSQGVARTSPNFRTPEALLARLSGVGKFSSPFKPKLVGGDSFLARLAAQFARRPLGNTPAGKLASEMLALADSLACGRLSSGDLSRLEALCLRSEGREFPADARDFCTALARAVMLRPLTDALAELPSKDMRTRLAEALHGQVEHLFSARNEFQFFQAEGELAGMRETFKELGILRDEQKGIFDHLDSILAHRKDIAEKLDIVSADVEKMKNGEVPDHSVDELMDSANRVCELFLADGDAPAMARVGTGLMRAKAESLASELTLSISETSAGFATRMEDLARDIRRTGGDLAALGSEVATLKDDLGRQSRLLTSDHAALLQGMAASLDRVLQVSQLLNEADELLGREGVSSAELLNKSRQLAEALAMHGLDSEDEARLNEGLGRLEPGIAHIHRQALRAEEDFASRIEEKLDKAWGEESFNAILHDIEERREALPHADLSQGGRESASGRLAELQHQAELGKFMIRFGEELVDFLELKDGTPALAELSGRLEEAKGRGLDTKEADGVLAGISKEHLASLKALADRQDKDIDASSKPSEVKTFFESMAEEAQRFLLPSDKADFDQMLERLIQKHGDAIYAKEAAPNLKGAAFSSLTEAHRAALKELCLSTGCPASLFNMLNDLEGRELTAVLEAFQRIQNARAAGQPPLAGDVGIMDAHFLRYPELDDAASLLLRQDGPDYRFDSVRMIRDLKAYMEQNFSSGLHKRLDLAGADKSEVSVLAELVAYAARARLADKAKLQQVDFTLIQALWVCRKAGEPSLSFEEFKLDLPEPYRGMPLLKEYMDAGISGRRTLKNLGNTLSLSSQGMGTRWALTGFLTEAQVQNVKWSAGLGVKGLYRELGLEEHASLTGHYKDILKGVKRAGGKDVLADIYGGMLSSAWKSQKDFLSTFDKITQDEQRRVMAGRLGLKPEDIQDVEKGSSLAVCVLLMDSVLSDPGISWEEQRDLVAGMDIQHRIYLDNSVMRGEGGLLPSSDENGQRFKKAKAAMKDSRSREDFELARKDMLSLIQELRLAERAEAVLYFKNFTRENQQDPAEAVNGKLDVVVRAAYYTKWEEGGRLRALCDRKAGSVLKMLDEHGIVAGAGHKQNEAIREANKDAEYVGKEAGAAVRKISKIFDEELQEKLTKLASLAVCEQITLSHSINTLDDLKNAMEEHKDSITDWTFYTSAFSRLKDMGLPQGVASLFLHMVLDSIDADFFVKMAKSGQKGENMKDRIASLVSAQMSELREHGRTLTLSRTSGGSLSLVAGEAGVADVGVIIQSARENGLSVWKDEGGTYHMTVMDGAKAGVTAEIAAEFKKLIRSVSLEAGVRAEAGVDGSLAHGCDLSFANSAHCQMFLFAILSRQTGPELFGLCEEASLVTEGGLGAKVGLSAKAHVSVEGEEALLATELGAGAEGGIKWSRSVSGGHTQRSRTVRGTVALKAAASLNLGVLEENVNSFAEKLKGKLTEKAEGKLDDVLSKAPEAVTDAVKEKVGELADEKSGQALDAFSKALDEFREKGEDGVLTAEKSCVFAYEETRTITERNSLTSGGRRVLEGYERVRAFAPENKAEAIDLMRQHDVSPACMSAILEHLKDMPASEGFRLELVSNMKASSVSAYNADPKAKLGKGAFELVEVRIVTEEAYEKERGLERGPVKVNVRRGFTRTQTVSFDPRLGAYERVVREAAKPGV